MGAWEGEEVGYRVPWEPAEAEAEVGGCWGAVDSGASDAAADPEAAAQRLGFLRAWKGCLPGGGTWVVDGGSCCCWAGGGGGAWGGCAHAEAGAAEPPAPPK